VARCQWHVMANARRKKRPPQCSYIERGRKCTRNGTGNPPLCAAHRIVLHEEASAGSGSPIADYIQDIVRRFRAGEPVSPQEWITAMAGAAAEMMAAAARRPRGPVHPLRAAPYRQAPPRPPPPPPPPPPPLPPRVDKLADARRVMGFAAGSSVTKAQVAQRRRELARKHHPDLARDPAQRTVREEQMRKINAAADLLEQAAP
jgi:hypothetical protein